MSTLLCSSAGSGTLVVDTPLILHGGIPEIDDEKKSEHAGVESPLLVFVGRFPARTRYTTESDVSVQ